MQFTLLENGEVFAPEPLGPQSLLALDNRIVRIGSVSATALETLGIEITRVDVRGHVVVPGLIDPHEHLLGGSGEDGFATQTPEISLSEIVSAGITTVVGCLGVDTTMKTMPGLLAKAKALCEEGMSAFIWSGGYNVPPTTIMPTLRDDILFVKEVIGAGEIAISDERSTDPDPLELARVITDARVGGMLTRKAGLVHFHVGERGDGLVKLRKVIEEHNVDAGTLYPTHVQRNEKLMREAIELVKLGAAIDIDTVDRDTARWLRFYLENGGDPRRLTVSTDASGRSPSGLIEQLRSCVLEHRMPLQQVLPFMTANTADVLKLQQKGRLRVGHDADFVVLEKSSLGIVHVISGGRWMMRDGELCARERFLQTSDRRIRLDGQA